MWISRDNYWVVYIVFRYFFILFSCLVSPFVWAAAPCIVQDPISSYEITADPNLANVGDVIGRLSVSITIESCSAPGRYYTGVYLGVQPLDPLASNIRVCQTTVSGIGITHGGAGGECRWNYVGGSFRGPIVGVNINDRAPSFGTFPVTKEHDFQLVKTGPIPAGVHQVSIKNSNLALESRYELNGTLLYFSGNYATIPPGELIGSNCSLATTLVPVDFGDVVGTGASRSFQIEFDSCTDQQDASAYNNAISLAFSSERIRPDGSALRNCTMSDCAQGVQVELQDVNGSSISLTNPYKLSGNSPVIGQNGLVYTFNAEIKPNPDETLRGGKIDTQLVFETIVE